MLDIKFIRQNPDKVQWACEVKRIDLTVAELLAVDAELVAARRDLEGLQKQRNDIASRFHEQKTEADRAALTAEGRQVADRIAELQEVVSRQSETLKGMMLRVPNIPHPDVPVGPDETHNRVVEKIGAPRTFDFKVRDHVELLELNGWAEFERLPKVSGSRSYALRGDMAVLEQSLLLMALKRLRPEGFEALTVPALVREQAFIGTGHFPTGRAEAYHLPADDLYLAGTAEVPITSLHTGEILAEKDLPKLYVGFSPCFRREAGSAGKDVRGLLRVHQFNKVEQFVICRNDPAESQVWHQKLLGYAKQLLDDLELPYQVIECCTGDMGAGKVRMHDIETWLPSQQKYRETHSCSTLHDWQARRADLRYRTAAGGIEYLHTLNNTLVATPRILAQILENHQRADGSIYLPPILRPIFDGRDSIGGRSASVNPG